MPLIILILLLFGTADSDKGSLLMCKSASISLFSEAPLENIEAHSSAGVSVLNAATGEIQFTVPIRSFEFRKKLMQEHFNENYMESDKYPHAKFKGKFIEEINPEKDGEYPVTVTGDLEVHGIKRPRTIKGIMSLRNNKLSLSSAFDVKCQDHKVKIPQIVFQKIAETIRVKVNATYSTQ